MTPAGPAGVIILAARQEDADGIAAVFMESAELHARLEPERYLVPERERIAGRYREGRQHPPRPPEDVVTLVAELGGEVAGFVDARLEWSFDAMHREMTYCYIAEIAVRAAHRSKGIGAQLLRAAEDWGRRRGAHLASLEYNAANTRAQEFYLERMGYRAASITAVKRL